MQEWSMGKDVIKEYQKQKFYWVGHIARSTDKRWTSVVVGIQENENNHLEDFHDDGKMKLGSNSDQHGEKEQDQVWKGNTLWPAICNITDGLTNKEIRKYISTLLIQF